MSCASGTSKVLVALVAFYVLVFLDKPLLPDAVRVPLVKNLERLSQTALRVLDPLLKLVGLDKESRTGTPYPDPVTFDQVPELNNDAELSEALSKNKRAIVLGYAPWCGHCKAMKGDYAEFYEIIKNDVINFPEGSFGVYRYDASQRCESDPKSCQIEALRPHIQGFPTILLVETNPEGKIAATPYQGARKADALEKFALDQILEPIMSENADQVATYLGEFDGGILHYVPPQMSVDQARKFSVGFSMRQQIFTQNYAVVKKFLGTGSKHPKDQHIMLAFNAEIYKGIIPKNSPAPVATVVKMYAENAMGFFSDREFMTSQLPRYLLLTSLKSKTFDNLVLRDYLSHGFIQPQIVGQAAIVLLDSDKDTDRRVANMVGIANGEQDCMVLFDQMTSKRYGTCVPCVAEWLSHEEFADYWLKGIRGELPEVNNANYKQPAKCETGQQEKCQVTVLSKGNVEAFVKDNAKVLLFTYAVAKHQDKAYNKFLALGKQDASLAAIDLSIDQTIQSDILDITLGDKEKVMLFVGGKFVDSFEGDITRDNVAKFLAHETAVPDASVDAAAAAASKQAAVDSVNSKNDL